MKRMNKISISLLIVVLLISTAAKLFAQKANFSGKWVVDPKSMYQESFHLGQFVAVDKDEAITIQTITKTDRDAFWNRTLSYDGKVSEAMIPEDDHIGKRTSQKSVKRSEDGASITITDHRTADYDGKIDRYTLIEVWTLSADGKQLTSKMNLYNEGKTKPSPMSRVVYNKQ